MSKYSTSFERTGAYLFDPGAIAEVTRAIAKFTENDVTINVSLRDDHNVQNTDVQAILTDSYVLNREIKRLHWTSYGHKVADRKFIDNGRQAQVTIGERYFSTIDVSISGDRDACSVLRGELEIIFTGAEQWYARFIRFPGALKYFLSGVIGFLFFLGGASAIIALAGKEAGKDLIWWSILPAFIGLWLLELLQQKLFPRVTFNIGKSADKIQSSRYWRNIVFSVIILGIVAGIAASLIYDRLK